MYGLTRAPITLLAAGVAGFLVWVSTRINDHSTGGYWAVYGILAGAGLVMALSQLLGGWTKWGWPRISPTVLLLAFVPTAIAVAWIAVAGQPHPSTTQSHVLNWSGDIGIRGLVHDVREYFGVLAFGLGLVFGFSFDTTGPAVPPPAPALRDWEAVPAPAEDVVVADGGTAVNRPAPEREPAATR
jgi:hypothetical protein